MISLIEAQNYRCLRSVRQEVGPFHVLVGPNASGKTTFLDVVAFLGRLVSGGLEAAIGERTSDFQDLTFGRVGTSLELAIEAKIPEDRKRSLKESIETIRYELRIGLDEKTREVGVRGEKVWLLPKRRREEPGLFDLFPRETQPLESIVHSRMKECHTVLTKVEGGNDNYYSEMRARDQKGGYFPSIRLGPKKLALANLPDDETVFPATTWLRRMLQEGIQQFVLNSVLLRQASAPTARGGVRTDGSNLPWVIHRLEQPENADRLTRWIEHVQTALPDLEGIRTVEMPDTRHRFLMLRYRGGMEVPSWTASDGTLRLLALTVLAYLPDLRGTCLIEEPENGIHPSAVETLYQSLSSVYDAQILLATHSPVILSMAKPDKVLCFKKTASGATDIVRGDAHPALREWQGDTSLGSLLAAGVL